ncbi:single-stranded DNA-binding protein [Criblamydia sequanensis]|uniref:Single-stranded DNA-binding protein n=1 Tax=Candidatus Criblamydia sequanensis CRIB-18 TaxID=1437425 RepID=A0A090E361_9BACT|nr:single-stranded DNA-binding protein [Criblamydia sequanensis]CDR35059.1 Single-stranded DNA-binding protein [Criblamydia sequanensis CRIB-18]
MMALNKVFIAGRLTRKPELRKTPNGMAVTDLFVALNREFVTQGGEKQQEVCFVDVVVWGKQAEACVQYLDCSSTVFVEGRLQLDVWYGKDANDKRCKLRVAADRVQFLDRLQATQTQEKFASQAN